jgi:hypothetical protein
MPLYQQLIAVVINAFFVVYQGWASAALNIFACQKIDTGLVDETTPSYYANFQQVERREEEEGGGGVKKEDQIGGGLSVGWSDHHWREEWSVVR